MTLILTHLSKQQKKKMLANPQTWSASLASRLVVSMWKITVYSIRGPRSCPRNPQDENRPVLPAATIIIHLPVYYLHMSSTAVEHHNSGGCVISYRTAAISCSGPWQNTTWWLFQSQAKTAEAEGSATRPGSLLFIIQFPDWWLHKPAAKCCVLCCQQTNGLNGRQGE